MTVPIPLIVNPYCGQSNASPVPQTDYTSAAGAEALARRLQQYWHRLGRTSVRVRAEQHTSMGVRHQHVVRSNLVKGMPPK